MPNTKSPTNTSSSALWRKRKHLFFVSHCHSQYFIFAFGEKGKKILKYQFYFLHNGMHSMYKNISICHCRFHETQLAFAFRTGRITISVSKPKLFTWPKFLKFSYSPIRLPLYLVYVYTDINNFYQNYFAVSCQLAELEFV